MGVSPASAPQRGGKDGGFSHLLYNTSPHPEYGFANPEYGFAIRSFLHASTLQAPVFGPFVTIRVLF